MSNNEIPPDVLEQARQAAEGARQVMNAPATGEPVQQPKADVPPDMSNVPDAYDVQGQEVYRAEQREQAVAQVRITGRGSNRQRGERSRAYRQYPGRRSAAIGLYRRAGSGANVA